MEGRVDTVPLRCTARTHALHQQERFIRVRCKDNRCPDVQLAKARGLKVYHVYDTANYVPALGTYLNWPEYEPDSRQEQE